MRDRTTVRRELWVLLPVVAAAAVAGVLATRHGVGAGEVCRVAGSILLTQVLPGALLWRTLRPRHGWLVEDLGLGAAIGAALAVPAEVGTAVFHGEWVAWALPWGLVVAVLLVPALRARALAACWRALPRWWGLGPAAASMLILGRATTLFDQPMAGTALWANGYVDLPYHQALAAEVSVRFPPHTPQVASEPLQYHWFSHAWLAQLSGTSGVDLAAVILRIAPIALVALVPLVMACAGLRLFATREAADASGEHVTAAAVAPVVASVLGPLVIGSAWLGGPSAMVLPTSLSTTFALLVAMALLALLAMRWRGEVPPGVAPVVFALAFVVGGSKGSWLPVVVAGLALAAVAAYVGRSPWRRTVLLDLCLGALALVLLLKFLFHGNEGGMTRVPFTSLLHSMAAAFVAEPKASYALLEGTALTVLILLSLTLQGIGMLVLLRDRATRGEPILWLLIGVVGAGVGAVLVFDHPGLSQFYFWYASAPCLSLGVAWGLVRLHGQLGRRSGRGGLLVIAIGVLVGYLAFGPGHNLVPGRGRLTVEGGFTQIAAVAVLFAFVGACLGVVGARGKVRTGLSLSVCALLVAGFTGAALPDRMHRVRDSFDRTVMAAGPRSAGSVARGQIRAYRYLAAHAGRDDLVMTNRHCRRPETGPHCDHRDFWLQAYSGLRTLVGGWAYTRQANESDAVNVRRSDFWDPALLHLNDTFYTHPTAAAAARLWELGVRWVYVDATLPHVSLSDVATRVFDVPTAQVYRLHAPGRSVG